MIVLTAAAGGCEDDLKECDFTRLAECDEIVDWECDEHTIIMTCNDGYTCRLGCEESCSRTGKSYLGHCGPTYNEQSSPSGDDICWCN